MQVGDLLDGGRQLGPGRQGQPVVEKSAPGPAGRSGGRRRQAHQAPLLQAFDADVGRTEAELAFAIAPTGALAKLPEQFLARGRIGLKSSGGYPP
jgi:hypothetical protein